MQDIQIYNSRTYPILQMPNRKFPGIVIQGDTLHFWYLTLKELLLLMNEQEQSNEYYTLLNLYEDIEKYIYDYEKTLEEQQIELPYRKVE